LNENIYRYTVKKFTKKTLLAFWPLLKSPHRQRLQEGFPIRNPLQLLSGS